MAKAQFINVELGGWGGGKDLGGVGGGESVIQIYIFSKIISDYIFNKGKEEIKTEEKTRKPIMSVFSANRSIGKC